MLWINFILIRIRMLDPHPGTEINKFLATSLNYLLSVQILTTYTKLKIKEEFKSVIQIWANGRQFKFINLFPVKI